MNQPLHQTRFEVWWDHLDKATGKLVRNTKEFRRKEEAALFLRKTPHVVDQGAAGCHQITESREIARDGKTKTTIVRQDVWTFREIVDLVGG
jgi:hypothetical protein